MKKLSSSPQTARSSSNSSTAKSTALIPGSLPRGSRCDPVGGAQFPGKGLSSSQTRNSLTPRR